MNNNEKLVELFENLAFYQNEKHENKPVLQKIYKNAATLISQTNKVITLKTKINDPLMSKGIYDIIKEFLNTGRSEQLFKLQKKYNPKEITETKPIEVYVVNTVPKKVSASEKIELLNSEDKKIVKLFLSFYGIGPVKALELFNRGYTTLEQLWDDKDKVLTQSQQLGIIWRKHIPVRIPREELFLIYDLIYSILEPLDIKFEIAGSFRRKEPTSGDIDLLIQTSDEVYMAKILDLLDDYLPAIFSEGEKKSSGMFRFNEDYYGHRIDILLIEEESWPLALLYFTGSATFNRLIRQVSVNLGYKLNEYNLIKGVDEIIDIKTEKDVFDELNLKYLSPEERTNNLTRLASKSEIILETKKDILLPKKDMLVTKKEILVPKAQLPVEVGIHLLPKKNLLPPKAKSFLPRPKAQFPVEGGKHLLPIVESKKEILRYPSSK